MSGPSKGVYTKVFQGNSEKYKEVFGIIDKRWECQMHHPLYAAGHYLNPEFFYKDPSIEFNNEIIRGLYQCIERLVPQIELQDQIMSELPLYKNVSESFGSGMTIRGRTSKAHAEWWSLFRCAAPNLQQLAIKILSLTCSASGCERNWSVFEQGFRKIDPDQWEFANKGFLRGQKHLLKTIKRRKTSYLRTYQQQHLGSPFLEVGQFGLDEEVERLKRDKCILMAEFVKLRQEQQTNRAHLKAMEDRLQATERRQHQMMACLARAIRSPDLLVQLFQRKERRKAMEEAVCRKKRRGIEEGSLDHADTGSSTLDTTPQSPTKSERGRAAYGELNDEFWEELINENNGKERNVSDGCEEDDAGLLGLSMGYLSPTGL